MNREKKGGREKEKRENRRGRLLENGDRIWKPKE